MELILAIDQGTTNTKALLVGPTGEVVAGGSSPVGLVNPRPGWFEQDAEEIWDSVLAAVGRCLDSADDARPVAIAISNQRESVVAWSRSTGMPLGPVLGWQDARTADATGRLVAEGVDDEVHRLTGLRLSPMFSAPKIRWLLDSLGEHRLRDICVGTVDAYLVSRLTGEVFATEGGNASRTLLCSLDPVGWSPRLLEIFGIPVEVLPQIRASDAGFGVTRGTGPIPAGIPIRAVLGDSHAALFGHGLTGGSAKVTYGTGSSVMAPITAPGDLPDAVSTTIAWCSDEPVYAREGNIFATGAAIDTIARLLGAGGVSGLASLAEKVDSSPLSIVPAFSGLGAPYWDQDAVAVIVGLARESSREELAYAALDAVAQQVCDVLDAVAAAGDRIEALHADGGATVNSQLMQLQADLSGRPVTVSRTAELSALGAAALAWRALGAPAWPQPEGKCYEPRRDAGWRRAQRDRWRDAVSRSRARRPG